MQRELDDLKSWEFDGGGPVKPLVARGAIWYHDWGTPDRWLVDAEGQAWAQTSGHGGPLTKVTPYQLLAMPEADDSETRRMIADALSYRAERVRTAADRAYDAMLALREAMGDSATLMQDEVLDNMLALLAQWRSPAKRV